MVQSVIHNGEFVWCVSDFDIERCRKVLAQLLVEPHGENFIPQVKTQMMEGYKLVALEVSNRLVVVAGFKLIETLSWGRILYLDDLATEPTLQRKGYGSAMMTWLQQYAQNNGCRSIHLDSGLQRGSAHEFYKSFGLQVTCYHFALDLNSKND